MVLNVAVPHAIQETEVENRVLQTQRSLMQFKSLLRDVFNNRHLQNAVFA